MSEDQWSAVDAYFDSRLLGPDPVLEACLQASVAAQLPPIQVSPTQGKLLHLLARSVSARRILEVGTLGGYSTTWLARALPEDGRVITLELEARHAEVARANLERAGLASRVEIRLGPAIETLPKLAGEGAGPFDFVFIDADKPSTRAYFEWALKLVRPGAIIVVDNVVRKGELANASSKDANVRGMREFVDWLSKERDVHATGIQTVGSKGYDGFVIAWVEPSAHRAAKFPDSAPASPRRHRAT